MVSNQPVPLWLWRAVTLGFYVTVLSVAVLATALALGLADPPRAGPLRWEETFKGEISHWQFGATEGAEISVETGALVATFTAPEQMAWAVTDAPTGDFTLEVAAAQAEGALGAQYGVVFDWRSGAEYAALLINGNGYAHAFRQTGGVAEAWFPFQQWPHILYGVEANRVRADLRENQFSARINDELLIAIDLRSREDSEGLKLGVLARSIGPGRVVFGWVRVWASNP